jgi:hypothetical protein
MTRIRLSICLALGLLICGCAKTPWVKPYERARLDSAVMNLDRDPLMDTTREQALQLNQAAHRAGMNTGPGCGCKSE